MTFTIFDIIILSLIALSTILGLYRGLIFILVDGFGVIVTLLLTVILAPRLTGYVEAYISHELLRLIVTYIVTYILLSVILSFISSKIVILLSSFMISSLDTISGGIVGVIRGGLISVLIFGVIAVFTTGSYAGASNLYDVVYKVDSKKYPSWVNDSSVAVYLSKGFYTIMNMFSQDSLKAISLPNISKENMEDDIDSRTDSSNKNIDNSLQNDLQEAVVRKLEEVTNNFEQTTKKSDDTDRIKQEIIGKKDAAVQAVTTITEED